MFGLANFNFVLQLLFCETLFAIYMPKRSKFALRYGCGATAALAIGFFTPFMFHSIYLFLLLIIGLFMMTVLFWWFCLKGSFLNGLFVGIAGYAVQHLHHKVDSLIKMFVNFNPTAYFDIRDFLISISLLIVIGIAAYFLFARQLKKTALKMDSKQFLFIATVVLAFSVIISGGFAPEGLTERILLYLYAIICCFLSLYLLMGMVKHKNLETELEIVNQLRYKEKMQYAIAKENIEAINIKCHDLKHQLRAFAEKPVLDKTVLKDIESAVDIYESFVKTGNDALNVVLAEKSFLCKKEHIALSCIADGEKLSFIPDADVYSMFGNIIDNAIEAVSKLPDEQERRISLRIKTVGNMLSVCEENKFVGELRIKDGLPCTTKDNKRYHGFGMRSIAMTVEKYGGVMNLNAENGLFSLDVLFQIA